MQSIIKYVYIWGGCVLPVAVCLCVKLYITGALCPTDQVIPDPQELLTTEGYFMK